MQLAWLGMTAVLSGCVMAWGASHKVEFANSSSITISSDPAFTNMGELQGVAQEHCDKFGRDAIPQVSQDGAWGLRSTTYRCVNR